MKATYRAKFNALCAMNDGYSFITIKRCNEIVSVYLDDILSTPNGNKVAEYEEQNTYELPEGTCMSFKELLNYSK